MAENDIWAVVPIKETGEAKQRLAEFVPAHLRPGLALAMFEDVMTALAAAPGLAGVVVVTADNAAARIAKRYKARVFAEESKGGHTAVIAAAAQRLAREECGSSELGHPLDGFEKLDGPAGSSHDWVFSDRPRELTLENLVFPLQPQVISCVSQREE